MHDSELKEELDRILSPLIKAAEAACDDLEQIVNESAPDRDGAVQSIAIRDQADQAKKAMSRSFSALDTVISEFQHKCVATAFGPQQMELPFDAQTKSNAA